MDLGVCAAQQAWVGSRLCVAYVRHLLPLVCLAQWQSGKLVSRSDRVCGLVNVTPALALADAPALGTQCSMAVDHFSCSVMACPLLPHCWLQVALPARCLVPAKGLRVRLGRQYRTAGQLQLLLLGLLHGWDMCAMTRPLHV